MSTAFLIALVKPILAVLVFGLIVAPIKWVIDKLWPDSELKRGLFEQHHWPRD